MAKKAHKKDLSLLEIINDNLLILNAEYDELEDRVKAFRDVLCPFYKGHVNCMGCPQSIERLEECADEYRANIVHRPMLKVSPEFFAIEEREIISGNPMQKLQCDTCYFSDNCPQYKGRASCTINWGGELHTLEPKHQIDVLIQLQESRINIARTAELMDGGIPDQNLSNEIDRLTELISMKANITADKISFSMTATGGGGTAAGGGILSKIFGPKQEALPQAPATEEPIQIPATVSAPVKQNSKKD